MPSRRTALGSLVAFLGIGPGCLGGSESCNDDEFSPSVESNDVELSPGEEETLGIEADGVAGFRFVDVYPPEDIEIDVAKETVLPSPDVQLDSYPPVWYWSDCTSVIVRVPVRAHTDAEPGTYEYGVIVYSEDRNESVEERFTVTVSEK